MCICAGRIYGDTKSAQSERELVAVLEWEMLWGETPGGFQLPLKPSVHLAIYLTSDSISYCSHELHVCVKYRTYAFRNWQEVSSGRCEDNGRDEDSVLVFAGL